MLSVFIVEKTNAVLLYFATHCRFCFADNFKSLEVKEEPKKETQNDEFAQQRQATIREALKGTEGKAKTFGGGNRKVTIIAHICFGFLVNRGVGRVPRVVSPWLILPTEFGPH